MPAQSIPYRYRRQQQQDTQGSDQSDRLLMLLLQGWLQGNLQSEAMEGQSEARLKQIAAESLGARELERETQRGRLAQDEARSNQVIEQQKRRAEDEIVVDKAMKETMAEVDRLSSRNRRMQSVAEAMIRQSEQLQNIDATPAELASFELRLSEAFAGETATKEDAMFTAIGLNAKGTKNEQLNRQAARIQENKKALHDLQGMLRTGAQQGQAMAKDSGIGLLSWTRKGGGSLFTDKYAFSPGQTTLIGGLLDKDGPRDSMRFSGDANAIGPEATTQLFTSVRSMVAEFQRTTLDFTIGELEERIAQATGPTRTPGAKIKIGETSLTLDEAMTLRDAWKGVPLEDTVEMSGGPMRRQRAKDPTFFNRFENVGGSVIVDLKAQRDKMQKSLEARGLWGPPKDNLDEVLRLQNEMLMYVPNADYANLRWNLVQKDKEYYIDSPLDSNDPPRNVTAMMDYFGEVLNDTVEGRNFNTRMRNALPTRLINTYNDMIRSNQQENNERDLAIESEAGKKMLGEYEQARMEALGVFETAKRETNRASILRNSEPYFNAAINMDDPGALAAARQQITDNFEDGSKDAMSPTSTAWQAYQDRLVKIKDREKEIALTEQQTQDKRQTGRMAQQVGTMTGVEGFTNLLKQISNDPNQTEVTLKSKPTPPPTQGSPDQNKPRPIGG